MESDVGQKGRPSSSSTAIALSLAGGIIIILFGSIMPLLFFSNYHNMNSGGMMGGGGTMMGRFGTGFMGTGSFFPFFSPIVLISGIIVIIGAILLSKRPQKAIILGIIVLVFSAVALVGMGPSILGSIIGIIGGVIALSNNRSSAKYSSKSS
jgi:hypothetical protein